MKIGKQITQILKRDYTDFSIGVISILIYVIIFAGQPVFAGEDKASHYISLDPLGVVFGMARVEYQQNINEKSAWALRGIYWRSNTESWKWDSYGGGFSYRRYFTHYAPEGGWFGGGVDVLYTNAKYMGKEDNGYFVFPHAETGYTFSLKESKWLINPAVSLGNYIGNIEISNSNIPISGAGMRLSILLSYPF